MVDLQNFESFQILNQINLFKTFQIHMQHQWMTWNIHAFAQCSTDSISPRAKHSKVAYLARPKPSLRKSPRNLWKKLGPNGQWWTLPIQYDTVDGRNPANQLIGTSSHYLRGLIHPRWCQISSINSMYHVFACNAWGNVATVFGPN